MADMVAGWLARAPRPTSANVDLKVETDIYQAECLLRPAMHKIAYGQFWQSGRYVNVNAYIIIYERVT